MHRPIADKTLAENLSETMRALADNKLPNAVMFLMQIPYVWQYVAPDIRSRIENVISVLDIDNHAPLFVWALDFEPTKARAQQRIQRLTDAEVMSMIKIKPSIALADRALAVYAGSGSYAQANTLADSMIISLIPNFTTAHIDRLLEIVTENGEVHGSFQLIDVLRKILERKVLSREYVDKMLITCGKANYNILRALAEYVTEDHLTELAASGTHKWYIHEILNELKKEKVIAEEKYIELMKKFGLEDELEAEEDLPI